MITNSMSTSEIVHEIYKDLPSVSRKIDDLFPKFRRMALKSKDQRYQQFLTYKSKRLNDWLLYIDYNKKDPTFLLLVTYITNQGFFALMVKLGSFPSITHYSGHFLERYNQRFLKEENLSKTEIFKKYIVRNAALILDKFGFGEEFFARTNDGIALGEIDENDSFLWYKFKTFITPEMIHDGQTEKLELTTKLFTDYWNEE